MQSTLVSVLPNEVPAFLHTSGLYGALSDEDPNDPFQVPANCIKTDNTVYSLGAFAQLLRVMIYWVLPDIPRTLIQFCDVNDFSTWRDVFEENLPENVLVKNDMRFIFDNTDGNPDRRIIRAMKIGRTDVVKYFASTGEFSEDADITATAASLGRLDYLILLRERGFFWSARTCKEAAAAGRLECLAYARAQGCPWGADTAAAAVISGHLNCLIYGRQNGCPWLDNLSKIAAEHGQLECLRYIYEQGGAWTEETCVAAAANGHDHCLEYLNYNSCPWDERVTLEAARGGHARCLEYAIVYSCPVHPDAAGVAAGEGHLDCLRVMWDYGGQKQDIIREYPQFSKEELRQKIQQTHFSRDLVLNESVTSQAVIHNRMDVLLAALREGCPCSYSDDLVTRAAQVGNVVCLRHLVENEGMYMSKDVFIASLLQADLHCLRYLVDQGCPYLGAELDANHDFTTLLTPDYDGRLRDCIEFAIERGWQVDAATVQFVRDRGLVQCQNWLQADVFWSDRTPAPNTAPTTALARGFFATAALSFFKLITSGILKILTYCGRACGGEAACESLAGEEEEETSEAAVIEEELSAEVVIHEQAPPPQPPLTELLPSAFDVLETEEVTELMPPPQPSVTEVLLPSAFDELYARYEQGEVFDESAMAECAAGDYVDCMQFLRKIGCPWDETTTDAAAGNGRVDALHLSMRNGCRYSLRVVERAVWSGNVHCVVYLVEYCRCPCLWQTGAEFRATLLSANFECLAYLVDRGYPIANYSFDAILDREASTPLDKGDELLGCLIYAVGSGYQWSRDLVDYLRVQRFTQCVNYLEAVASPSPDYTMPCACHGSRGYVKNCHHAWMMAGFAGCLTCMTELHKHYAPLDPAIAAAAAAGGNLNCVVYLHEHDCAWDARTTNAAARHGHTDVLRHVVSLNCEYTNDIVELAAGALNNSLACLTYAVDELFCTKVDKGRVLGAALMRADVDCVRYLLESGVCGLDSEYSEVEFIGTRARISRSQDADLLQCVDLCIRYGWKMNSAFDEFVSLNNFMLCLERS